MAGENDLPVTIAWADCGLMTGFPVFKLSGGKDTHKFHAFTINSYGFAHHLTEFTEA